MTDCAQLCRFVLCYRPISRERYFTPRSHAGKKVQHFSDLTVHTGLPPPRGPDLTLLVAHVRCVVARLATEVISSRPVLLASSLDYFISLFFIPVSRSLWISSINCAIFNRVPATYLP